MMTHPINNSVAQLVRQANDAAGHGDLKQAQQFTQEAVDKAKTTLHKQTQVVAHYTYAVLLWQDETASVHEAHDHAKQAADLATRHTDEYYLAVTLLARIEGGIGSFQGAERLLEHLLSIYQRKNRMAGVADVLRSLGDLALKQGHLTQAHEYFAESLTLYQNEINDPLNQAGLLLSLGSLYFQEQQLAIARQHWQEALQIGQSAHLPQVITYATQSLQLLPQKDTLDE